MVEPAFFAKRFLGAELHDGQRRWLAESSARENVLVTGNRWGKSFVSAVKLIHHAIYRPRRLEFDRCGRYRAVVASITQDQANLTFNQVVRFIRRSPLLESLVTASSRSGHPSLTFGNGASIEARSTQNRGEYLLGNDYDLFIFDEVAFETDPEYVVEEVIMMRLADRAGRLDLVSTPNGRNWFYRRVREIERRKRPGYVQSGDSRENGFVSRDYLDERVRYFNEARLKQNIMGQFVDSGGEILPGRYVDRALEKAAGVSEPVTAARRSYLSGWDLARKRTATVGVTVELVDGVARVVRLERFRRFDWMVVIEKVKARQRMYPGRLIIDATGLGDVVVEQLAEYNPEAVVFTPAVKAELLTNVELFHARDAVSYDRWEMPDGTGGVWSLEDELRQARWDQNSDCDALMALALALWPLRKRSRPQIRPRLARV
ncbi:MAG TPA: terminase family protein [Acidobacteriota bacterium]|nr:terminase family protein [Acidobacteriota bacterium]